MNQKDHRGEGDSIHSNGWNAEWDKFFVDPSNSPDKLEGLSPSQLEARVQSKLDSLKADPRFAPFYAKGAPIPKGLNYKEYSDLSSDAKDILFKQVWGYNKAGKQLDFASNVLPKLESALGNRAYTRNAASYLSSRLVSTEDLKLLGKVPDIKYLVAAAIFGSSFSEAKAAGYSDKVAATFATVDTVNPGVPISAKDATETVEHSPDVIQAGNDLQKIKSGGEELYKRATFDPDFMDEFKKLFPQ